LPQRLHGFFAPVWFAFAFAFVDNFVACGCCTGCDGVAFPFFLS
jgi:hypothetical protein